MFISYRKSLKVNVIVYISCNDFTFIKMDKFYGQKIFKWVKLYKHYLYNVLPNSIDKFRRMKVAIKSIEYCIR